MPKINLSQLQHQEPKENCNLLHSPIWESWVFVAARGNKWKEVEVVAVRCYSIFILINQRLLAIWYVNAILTNTKP